MSKCYVCVRLRSCAIARARRAYSKAHPAAFYRQGDVGGPEVTLGLEHSSHPNESRPLGATKRGIGDRLMARHFDANGVSVEAATVIFTVALVAAVALLVTVMLY